MKRYSDTKMSINRRKFLQTARWAALAPFAPGLFTGLGGGGRSGALKAGLLIPSSEIYPDMGKNFLAGMEAYRKISRSDVLSRIEFIVKDTGVGQARVLKAAQNLIESENVRLITGIIDPSLNPDLVDLCAEKQVLLMANNAGANLYTDHAGNPWVFQNSMQYCQSNHAMGLWAARNLGRRAVVAASFFESGYDAMYAFGRGFEEGGGKILKTVISKKPDPADDSRLPVQTIRDLKPDVVFAAYSGTDAVEFVRLFSGAGLSATTTLVTSGFMTDDHVLNQLGPESTGIISCHSWVPGLVNDANASMTDQFRTGYGRTPDAFAVMGFETAILIGVMSGPGRFPASINSQPITGPRGHIKYNPQMAGTETAIYVREVKQVNGKPQNSVIAELNYISAGPDPSLLAASGPRTGWLNAYLCV